MATLQERVAEFYRRLGSAPAVNSADEALALLARTLDEVEDEMSGIPKKTPAPPPRKPDGRMYPPQSDFILRHSADGRITAKTRGHMIEISADGCITIRNKRTKDVEFRKEK